MGTIIELGVNMETFGFVYIIAYFVDCNFAILAAFFPVLDMVGQGLTIIVMALSTAVIGLSLIGKLRPRKIYLPLAIMYWFAVACGFVAGLIVGITIGIENLPQTLDAAYITKNVPWFGTFRWSFMAILEVVAICGLRSILVHRKKLKAEAKV